MDMNIHARVENGKAYLEFEFSHDWRITVGDCPGEGEKALQPPRVLIKVTDREQREIFHCTYPLWEEEPAKGLLLHPHLWNSVENPYVYHAKVYYITAKGKTCEVLEKTFALRTFHEIPGKGWFLNEKPFEVRAVKCSRIMKRDAENNVPDKDGCKTDETEIMLQMLRKMGANTILVPEKNAAMEMLCDRLGFVLLTEAEYGQESTWANDLLADPVPECEVLLGESRNNPADLYYHYKALWSKEPFVYLNEQSIKRQENGNLSLKVYSNLQKLALYVDGILLEFHLGEKEFLFEEIPVDRYPVILTVEGNDCSSTVALYDISHNFHRSVTFS